MTQKVLNVGTSLLEQYAPVKKICQHVCAFHFYAHDMSRQVRSPNQQSLMTSKCAEMHACIT